MQSKAETVTEYLAELPEDRRVAIEAIRKVIKKNLDKRFKEGMQYGMIGYFVPHSVYPDGYHCDPKQPLPFAGIASQKNHIGIYLMCIYMDPKQDQWFRQAWTKTGRKLDMGKSCIRCKNLEGVALDVVGEAIKRVTADDYIAGYESIIKSSGVKRKPAKKTAAKKKAVKKSASKKKAIRKTAAKKKAKSR